MKGARRVFLRLTAYAVMFWGCEEVEKEGGCVVLIVAVADLDEYTERGC